jgi:hypothetical protein
LYRLQDCLKRERIKSGGGQRVSRLLPSQSQSPSNPTLIIKAGLNKSIESNPLLKQNALFFNKMPFKSKLLTPHLPDIPSALFALFIRLLPTDERAVPLHLERFARRLVYYFVSDHCFYSFKEQVCQSLDAPSLPERNTT